MSEEKGNPRPPPFVWRNLGRDVVICIIDLALLLVTMILIGFFVRFFILWGYACNCNVLCGKDIVDIVKAVAWPLCCSILIFIFRNAISRTLYEIPGFVRRSWFRNGDMMTDPSSNDSNVGDSDDEHLSQQATGDKPRMDPRFDAVKAERHALMQLQREYGITVHRDKSIENSRFFFDGVMENEQNIFGIEVKINANLKTWREVFNRVGVMYSGFSNECKKKFIFIACVCGEDNSETREGLLEIRTEVPFRSIVKFFTKPTSKSNGDNQ